MRLKIGHKLFLAILVANILLASSIYFLTSWTFGSSFREYLDQSAAERLEPLVTVISEKYQQHNNWNWVKNRRAREWRDLMRQYILDTPRPGRKNRFNDQANDPPGEQEKPRRRMRDEGMAPPPENRPPEDRLNEQNRTPLGINPRLLLADANKNLIIGKPDRTHDAYWIPIVANKSTVGYLGFIRTLKLTSKLDQLFVNKLQTGLIWITLGLILITALIALPMARLMVKPVITLRRATSDLADGKYETRIAVKSRDEIGELSQDFNHLAETLAKNLNARQQWIADISHELRTPVAILQGEIEAIQDGIRNMSSQSINSLHQEIVSLSRLINDLHELSLSDMGALTYKKEIINIAELIDDVLQQNKEALNKKSLTTNFIYASANITINGDEQRLRQLFKNLINNSMHYTDSGGVIDISVKMDNNIINIIWSDSEPGVNDKTLLLLFDRLYRAEGSRNRNTGGSGLGLAICRNIVEAHHGTIVAKHSARNGVAMHMQFSLSRKTNPS